MQRSGTGTMYLDRQVLMRIERFFSRRLLVRLEKESGLGSPESYWVRLKSGVIGQATLGQLRQTRQVGTYRAIYRAIMARSVTQVLDLGCNIMALGLLLKDWGYPGSYIGVDSNPYALDLASQSSRPLPQVNHMVCANIRALPFAQRVFSCVVMKDVLEHMEDFRPLLSEAARVSLKYIIIANFIPWTEGKTLIKREPQRFYHNLYNRHEVSSFAQELGFGVEEVLSALETDARANEVVVFARSGV